MAVIIPTAMGYLNAGDAIVLLGAFVLGPVYGAAAGGIGSALADIFAGYALYAPATLLIKAFMAGAAGAILHRYRSGKLTIYLAALTGELIMVSGYCLYSFFFLGLGTAAFAEIPGNIAQGVFGALVSCSLFTALNKVPYIRDISM